MPLAWAVSSGRPFAIQVQSDILAADCDRPEARPRLWHVVENLGDYPYVVVESGQPGRLHLFARIPDLIAKEQFSKALRQAGIEVRKTIRPPLSPHRLGFISRIIDPGDEWEALERLRGPRMLPERVVRLLIEGDTAGRYPSRSEVFQAIALNFYLAGFCCDDLLRASQDTANEGIEAARTERSGRPRRDPGAYVRRAWNSARDFVAKHPEVADRELTRDFIAQVNEAALLQRWPGKGGLSAFSILTQAHVATAYRVGIRYGYGLASRRVMELAAIASLATLARGHRYLIEAGWLDSLKWYGPRATATWAMLLPKMVGSTVTLDTHPYLCTNDKDEPTSDLWLWSGLGKAAHRVYIQLQHSYEPVTARFLSDASGVDYKTVRRHLATFNDLGMAQRLADGHWLLIAFDHAETAKSLGVSGGVQRIKDHNLHHRETWREWHIKKLGTDPHTGEIISDRGR